jgi:hypothetical protein
MNRTETKCAGQIRYKTRAGADKMAAGTNGIYQGHACECGGYHVSKGNKTPQEKEREANDEYYGALGQLVRTMLNREAARMKASGLRRRKPHS